jgi:hypothetical protein
MKYIIFFLSIFGFLYSCKGKKTIDSRYKTKESGIYQNTQSETVKDFKHNGKYINPLLIGQFIAWVSDRFPYFRELDLTASDDSNRFYLDQDLEIRKDSIDPTIERVRFTPRNSNDQLNNEYDFIFCQYRYLGTLKNGVQVVYYFENSYGSFNPDGIFGFEFTKERVKGDSGKHIFMKIVDSKSVNQNVDFKLDKENNRVLVIPNSNLPAADFVDMDLKPYWIKFNKE